jgi:hypothetical protein
MRMETRPSTTFSTARVRRLTAESPVGVVMTIFDPSGVYAFWWK